MPTMRGSCMIMVEQVVPASGRDNESGLELEGPGEMMTAWIGDVLGGG